MELRKIKHDQLSIDERLEIGNYSLKYGINRASIFFKVNYSTAKRWHDRVKNSDDLKNKNSAPLTQNEHKKIMKYADRVRNNSIKIIKERYNLPYSLDTLTRYYNKLNIPSTNKYLLLLKCPECKKLIRVINIFWGKPRNIFCPHCNKTKLNKNKYIKIPFFNAMSSDYYFDSGQLCSVDSKRFSDIVVPLLQVPKNLKSLFIYLVKPRKLSRIHIINYFEKVNENIVPVTCCGVRYATISKRRIINPKLDEVDLEIVCQKCQTVYLKDYNRVRDQFPKIIEMVMDPEQFAIKLFLLAKSYDIKTAQALMGITNRKFYRIKKDYLNQYHAIMGFMNN